MDQYKRNSEYNQDLLRFKLRNTTNDIDQNEYIDRSYLCKNDTIIHSTPTPTTIGNTMMIPNTQNTTAIGSQDEQSLNYYQEYCRLFIANVVLTSQMKELVAEKNELIARINKLENKKNSDIPKENNNTREHQKSAALGVTASGDSAEDKKKKYRRVAAEIDRQFRCPVETCNKSYGCEGSLNQHLKLKHPSVAGTFELKISKKHTNKVKNESMS